MDKSCINDSNDLYSVSYKSKFVECQEYENSTSKLNTLKNHTLGSLRSFLLESLESGGMIESGPYDKSQCNASGFILINGFVSLQGHGHRALSSWFAQLGKSRPSGSDKSHVLPNSK